MLLRRFRSFKDEAEEKESLFQGILQAVVIVAHPDDEVFCSGLICELVQEGVKVRVLCLTKGEGGPRGDYAREVLGEVRAEEMKRSCDVLGVSDLIFLGHVDPEGRGYKVLAPEIPPEKLANQLKRYLEDADLIVSHGSSGEYWHPAHLLVYEALKCMFEDAPIENDPAWLTFSARRLDHRLPELVNWDDPAHFTFDGSRYERQRLRALDCHRTQLGLFSKFASGDHADFIRFTALECYALKRRSKRNQLVP